MKMIFKYLWFTTFLLGVIPPLAKAQNRACAYNQPAQVPPCLQKPYQNDPEMTPKIEKMLSKIGVQRNFYVLECAQVNNAMATVLHQELFILFNRSYLNRNLLSRIDETDLDVNLSSSKEDWAVLGVLAHEIAHHTHEHLLLPADLSQELQADEGAGFMLYQMGATLDQAKSSIFRYIPDNSFSTTHPPKSERLIAVEKGWRKAAAQYGYNNEQNYAKEWQLPSPEAIIVLIKGWRPVQTPQQVFDIALQMAEQGHKNYQYRVAMMYQQGVAVRVDYLKAHYWYTKAATQGHAAAQNNLGWMLQKGFGTEVNYLQAFYWYQKSAEQKNAFGYSNLAYLYDKGLGIAENKAAAQKLYCLAAQQGNPFAAKALSVLSINCP